MAFAAELSRRQPDRRRPVRRAGGRAAGGAAVRRRARAWPIPTCRNSPCWGMPWTGRWPGATRRWRLPDPPRSTGRTYLPRAQQCRQRVAVAGSRPREEPARSQPGDRARQRFFRARGPHLHQPRMAGVQPAGGRRSQSVARGGHRLLHRARPRHLARLHAGPGWRRCI